MTSSNTTILIKKSTQSGNTPPALANGEIAINTADGKLFYSDPIGIVKHISNQNSFATINVGSTLINATSPTDILNFAAGDNIIAYADPITKTITLSAVLLANSAAYTTVYYGPNQEAAATANSYVTSTTDQVVIDTFPTYFYQSAKYEVQMTSGSNYHAIELRVLHDGTSAWLAQYGSVHTNGILGSFDATISDGNFQLLFTPVNAVTTIRFLRTSLVI